MQVLEEEHEWLIQTLPQEQSFERLKRAPAANLRVHLLQEGGLLLNAQQDREIGECVFQVAVEAQDSANHALASHPFVIRRLNLEVALQQLDQRQIGRGFAVRNGIGFQHQAHTAGEELEFVEQA